MTLWYTFGFLVAALFLVFSFDDLFWDVYYIFWGRKRARSRLRLEDLDTVPRRLLAVLIPAWHEEGIIGPMVENLVQSMNYPPSLVHIFIGVYPNDEATQKDACALEERYPQVHMVVNTQNGPTSKAQNLNEILDRVFAFEEEHRVRFGCFIIHDAEDVVHPTAFKLINYLSYFEDIIQLPVFPLQFFPTWRTFFRYLTSSTYADEFAENHYRGLLARDVSRALVPSAGTGFVITHKVFDRIGKRRIFDETSLTEDYKLSLELARYGFHTRFFLEGVTRVLDNGQIVTEYIATREIFPNTLHEAVRQKSRWIYGIAFQSFSLREVLKNRELSSIAKYSLYRDWKAKWANLLPIPGYVVFTYFILSLFLPLSPIYPEGSPSWWCSLILSILMVERQIMRAIALKEVYGWRSAIAGCFIPPLLSIRVIWGNIVNFLATLRAWRIALFGFPKSRPRWQKTKHTYLPEATLARYRRKLGDLLLEKRVLEPRILLEVLHEKGENERLGEKLQRTNAVSEDLLADILGELLRTGALTLEHHLVPSRVDAELFAWCRKFRVVPVAQGKNSVILAGPQPLSTDTVSDFETRFGKRVFFVLAPEKAVVSALHKFHSPPEMPRLGEVLLQRGYIKEGHLVEALRAQRFFQKPLGEILVTMGVLLQEDLERVMEDMYAGIPDTSAE